MIKHKLQNSNNKQSGISLLEVLIVITIFAGLGILIASSIILTLQGTQKSSSIVKARESLDYSLSIIERQIRGAHSITSTCAVPPDAPSPTTEIDYLDQDGNPSSFSCGNVGTITSFLASGSAHLTSSSVVKITSCSFTCSISPGSSQPVIGIDLSMQDAASTGVQNSNVSASTQIYLRNY